MDGIADYDFARSLGAGGAGEFFLAATPARLPIKADQVAVKVIAGELSEEVFGRVTAQLQAFCAVRTPFRAPLFEVGQQSGVVYYAMEFLPDGSLADSANALDSRRTLRALAGAARAAHAMHEAGMVHNAIKPSNIFPVGDDGARLADPNLVHVISPGLTVSGIGSLNSVEFTDPGLLQGASASRASDIYSLGATVHRVATGLGVFGELPSNDPVGVLRTVATSAPEIAVELDPDLASIVRWCIESDHAARPATAAELADALEEVAI